MSRLLDAIKDKAVKPMLKENINITHGKIVEFNSTINKASVTYVDQAGNKEVTLYNISINTGQLGVIQFTPKPNDNVILNFINGIPIITGFLFSEVDNNIRKVSDHTLNNGSIPDCFCDR